jgi:hypothetical protein
LSSSGSSADWREEGGFGKQLRLQRQQVAEDAGQRDDARRCAAGRSVSSGISAAPARPAVAVEARRGAEQREGLARSVRPRS